MGKYRAPLANSDVIHLIENNKDPEQKLWIAVLAKSFDDAFYCSDERVALQALSWIRHGSDFNYVCGLAGRDPNYVRNRMLDKVIEREASILGKHMKIKQAISNVIPLKRLSKPKKEKKTYTKKEDDYKWLPKYGHDYVER